MLFLDSDKDICVQRRSLPYDYAYGPTVVLGGWVVSYERGTPVALPSCILPPTEAAVSFGAFKRFLPDSLEARCD